jgi:hypothetical protein
MLIIIPTRIFPGIILGSFFIFAGTGAGFAGFTTIFNFHTLRIFHLVFLPVFALAVLYVCQAWRGKTQEHDVVSDVAFMSPRLLAVLLGVCLICGLVCGVLVGYISN